MAGRTFGIYAAADAFERYQLDAGCWVGQRTNPQAADGYLMNMMAKAVGRDSEHGVVNDFYLC